MDNRYTPHRRAIVTAAMDRFFHQTMGAQNHRLFATQNPKFVTAMFNELMENIPDISVSPYTLDRHIRAQFAKTTMDRVQAMIEHYDSFLKAPGTRDSLFEDWWCNRTKGIELLESGRYTELVEGVDQRDEYLNLGNTDEELIAEAITEICGMLLPPESCTDFCTYNGKFLRELAKALKDDIKNQRNAPQPLFTIKPLVNHLMEHYGEAFRLRVHTYQKYISFYKKCCAEGQINGVMFEEWLVSSGRMENKAIERTQRNSPPNVPFEPIANSKDFNTRLRSVPSIFRSYDQVVNGVEHSTNINNQLQNPGLTDMYYAEAEDKLVLRPEDLARPSIAQRLTTCLEPTQDELDRKALREEFAGPSIAQLLIDESARITKEANAINKEGGNTRSMRISALSADSIRRGEFFRDPMSIDFTKITDDMERLWAFDIIKAFVRDSVVNGKLEARHGLSGLREIAEQLGKKSDKLSSQELTLMKEYSDVFIRHATQLAKATSRKEAAAIVHGIRGNVDDFFDLPTEE